MSGAGRQDTGLNAIAAIERISARIPGCFLRKHHREREPGLARHLDRTRGRRAEDEPVLVHPHLEAEMCQDTSRAYSVYPAGVSDAREHRRA